MSQQHGVEIESRSIREIAKQWEGLVVDGEFQLREYLGGSDRSAVFLTDYDAQDPRQAAIKLIPAGPEEAEKQLQRWELAANLSHPHLLCIFQIGRCRLNGVDLAYIVTEYAEENLSQILPQRSLTADETRALLGPVVEALAYLHDRGLVHAHLCPSNIMAIGDQIKLTMDCLRPAGEADEQSRSEESSQFQAAMSPHDNVWALGILLVESLTQSAPALDPSGLAEPVVPATLPAPFYDIACGCLCRDPRRRWTISEIVLGMRALPSPEDEATHEQKTPVQSFERQPEAKSVVRRNILSTLAFAVILVAIIAAPKLLRRGAGSESPAAASDNTNPPDDSAGAQSQSSTVPAANAVDAAKTNLIGARLSSIARQSTTATKSAAANTTPNKATKNAQPGILNQVLPDVPQSARDTITGTVRVGVRVQVDSSGNVQDAMIDSQGPSAYFADLATRAARQWKFAPAGANAQDAPREWILRFAFSALDTKVDAKAVAAASAPSSRLPADQ